MRYSPLNASRKHRGLMRPYACILIVLQQQAAEISKLEAELEALRAANDSLNRGLQQNQEALFQAGLNMERVKDTIKEMTVQHTQELEFLRKERDAALTRAEQLAEKHRDELERLVLEADSEKAALVADHKSEIDQLRTKLESGSGKDQRATEDELDELKLEISSLRKADDLKAQVVEKLTKEVGGLILQLNDTKAELKSLQQIDDMERKGSNNGRLETLTPTPSSTSTSTDATRDDDAKEGSKEGVVDSMDSTADASPWLSSTSQFSWSQFVFPMAKRNQSFVNQVRQTWFVRVQRRCCVQALTKLHFLFRSLFLAIDNASIRWIYARGTWSVRIVAQGRDAC